jgi:Putative metallopeptidase
MELRASSVGIFAQAKQHAKVAVNQEMPMSHLTSKAPAVIVMLAAAGLMSPDMAAAQQGEAAAQPQAFAPPAQVFQSGKIANNDSIFIDGTNFTVTPGRAKGNAASQIKSLGARDLGPGAIVFRSGEKLYIVSSPLLLANAHDQAGAGVYATVTQVDQPNRIKIQYDKPNNADLQTIYHRLMDHRYLERIQEILSPLRLPEDLNIKATQCGVMNAWYRRENSKPTVTICYELLKTVSQSMPKETTPDGIEPMDAAVGQAVWLALHETGHAVFDIFDVPIFGHSEDAADNFATYVMLHFGKQQAWRWINGAAWAWRGYVADYRTKPVIQEQLAGFASNHGQPQERFYNLMCLAYGADPGTFATLTENGFLPPNRAPTCAYEYKTLVNAFNLEIEPHVDQEMKRQVMDMTWLPPPESMPTAQK